MEVIIKDSKDEKEFDRAVKTFKKMVTKSGILQEINDRRYYQKPSVTKRLIKKSFRKNE